jgi:hypothetical protein
MNYKDLAAYIPLQSIVDALADKVPGTVDTEAWVLVQAAADNRIKDAFGGSVPDAYADSVEFARMMFLCEILYDRRGLSDTKNPFTKRAADQETRLRKLASGDEHAEGAGAGVVISKPASIANMNRFIS